MKPKNLISNTECQFIAYVFFQKGVQKRYISDFAVLLSPKVLGP